MHQLKNTTGAAGSGGAQAAAAYGRPANVFVTVLCYILRFFFSALCYCDVVTMMWGVFGLVSTAFFYHYQYGVSPRVVRAPRGVAAVCLPRCDTAMGVLMPW